MKLIGELRRIMLYQRSSTSPCSGINLVTGPLLHCVLLWCLSPTLDSLLTILCPRPEDWPIQMYDIYLLFHFHFSTHLMDTFVFWYNDCWLFRWDKLKKVNTEKCLNELHLALSLRGSFNKQVFWHPFFLEK